MTRLTELQAKFVEEYLRDGNATQAAKRAGYSPKTSYSQGQRLLKHVEIKEKLEQRRKELRDELQQQFTSDAVTAREVLFNILKDEDVSPHARVKAAIDFLDRAGFKAPEKVEQVTKVDLAKTALEIEEYFKDVEI